MLGFRWGWAAATLCWLGLAACTNLAPVQEGQCGNQILESATEDCDTFPLGADGGVLGPVDKGFSCSDSCQVQCATIDGGAGDAGDGGVPAVCPDGWGCGGDGICRRPSGSFLKTSVVVNEGVEHLQLGDIDGSGRKAIVVDTGSQLAVHFVDGNAALYQTSAFTAESANPSVGHFSSASASVADIAYCLESGLAVRQGTEDESLPALPFPIPLPGGDAGGVDLQIGAGELLVPVSVPPISVTDYKLKELLRLDPGVITTFAPDVTGNRVVIANVGSSAMPAGAEVVTGAWDEADECDQLAIANKSGNGNKGSVDVYYVCQKANPSQWNGVGKPGYSAPISVTLPAGVSLAGPIASADVDGDGHRDLVIFASGATPSSGQILVAYGNGAGAFGEQPGLTDNAAGTYFCLGRATVDGTDPSTKDCTTQTPLTFGVLGLKSAPGQGLHIVSPCGLLEIVNRGATDCTTLQSPGSEVAAMVKSRVGVAGAPWGHARVADLNGDGLGDVVAASCGDTSIAYLENAGNGTFDTFTLPTSGGIDSIVTGDFDGDLVTDFAYLEREGSLAVCDATMAAASSAKLGVVFGAISGGPSAATVLAPVGSVTQIVAGNLNSTIENLSSVDDIAVIATQADGGADGGAPAAPMLDIFEGSTDRQIIAPDFLISPVSRQLNYPWLVAVGALGANGAPGMAVVSAERTATGTSSLMLGSTANAWVFDYSPGYLDQTEFLPDIDVGDPGSYAMSNGAKGAWLGVMDLGGTAGDAILAVNNDATMGTSRLLVVSRPTLTGTWALSVDKTWTVPYGGPVVARDVDGDTIPDLVLLSAADGALVIWGKGDGTLDPDQATTISTADLAKACPPAAGAYAEHLSAATALRAAPGKPREILLLGQNRLYLATLSSTAPRTFTYACASVGDLTRVPTGTKVASGDVDGDGVDDVVVGAAGQLTLYRGTPVH